MMLAFACCSLPVDKPNHLLGIADEQSIWPGAALGVDTFDSCFPTRIARHGTLLTRQGHLYIRKGKRVVQGDSFIIRIFGWKAFLLLVPGTSADGTLCLLLSAIHAKDLRPLDEECTCSTCKTHSRSYLHHLYRAREPVVDTLLSVHNLQYMNDLMGRIRTQIMQDEL